MTTLITTHELSAALRQRDLSDPGQGPHAMQIILAQIVDALTRAWRCTVDVQRRRPLVAVEDNYDRLGYAPADIVRDARYTRYVAETVMLRSHTTAGIPPALRQLANTQKGEPASDVLLALPGLCYRRDSIDRLHVGTPHQVDLWRMTTAQTYDADLMRMAGIVIDTVLPGARWRAVPANHPYTRHGRQLDVETSTGWVELAECGLVAPHILAAAGLDPQRCSGLALGLGLDRAVMLRKGVDDIRQLRSADPRIAAQMLDLTRWQPVSTHPPIRRDLSIVTTGPPDAELLGGAVRSALGAAAEDLESVSILNSTPWQHLSPTARARLGLRPDQENVVLRLVLRPSTGASPPTKPTSCAIRCTPPSTRARTGSGQPGPDLDEAVCRLAQGHAVCSPSRSASQPATRSTRHCFFGSGSGTRRLDSQVTLAQRRRAVSLRNAGQAPRRGLCPAATRFGPQASSGSGNRLPFSGRRTPVVSMASTRCRGGRATPECHRPAGTRPRPRGRGRQAAKCPDRPVTDEPPGPVEPGHGGHPAGVECRPRPIPPGGLPAALSRGPRP